MRMTKKQFCECIVNMWEQKNRGAKAKEEDCKISSQLAVAMEYLGLLKSESVKNYAASCEGVLYFGYYDPSINNVPVLSMRDMLALLSD